MGNKFMKNKTKPLSGHALKDLTFEAFNHGRSVALKLSCSTHNYNKSLADMPVATQKAFLAMTRFIVKRTRGVLPVPKV